MAKTALLQLQDQIEAVRREAFAGGYAAAMQAIRTAASQPAPGTAPAAARGPGRPRSAASAQPTRAPPATAQAVPPQSPTDQRRRRRAGARALQLGRASGKRPQRGTNARLVAEVLQSAGPSAFVDTNAVLRFVKLRPAKQ